MMDHSAKAVENAIKFEAKKDGLSQRQNGDWTLRLTVQAIDMHQIIVNAAMGTRFFCTMNELNEDETPRDHKTEERGKWRDLGPAKQAGIRCKEPIFWAFLTEEYGCEGVTDEDAAASAVRELCGVASRSELSHPGQFDARQTWNDIDYRYQAWLVNEHA